MSLSSPLHPASIKPLFPCSLSAALFSLWKMVPPQPFNLKTFSWDLNSSALSLHHCPSPQRIWKYLPCIKALPTLLNTCCLWQQHDSALILGFHWVRYDLSFDQLKVKGMEMLVWNDPCKCTLLHFYCVLSNLAQLHRVRKCPEYWRMQENVLCFCVNINYNLCVSRNI